LSCGKERLLVEGGKGRAEKKGRNPRCWQEGKAVFTELFVFRAACIPRKADLPKKRGGGISCERVAGRSGTRRDSPWENSVATLSAGKKVKKVGMGGRTSSPPWSKEKDDLDDFTLLSPGGGETDLINGEEGLSREKKKENVSFAEKTLGI